MSSLNTDKTLFLLTKTYPFGNGEQYITNELEYLAQHFKKIIIYPNDYYSNDLTHIKQLPANAEVLNFNAMLSGKSDNTFSDYLYLLKVSLQEFAKTDDKSNFFGNFKWNLSNFWLQFQISKPFSKYLQEHNCTSANTVFYSYWFHKSAILLSILKDKEAISKFASRAHSVDLYHNNWGIVNEKVKVPSFKMFKFKHTALLLPISNHGHKFLKDKYSSILPNIKLSYLGVGVPAQKPQTYDADNFHIVTCSGIDFNKRIHKLAEALCQIKKPVKWTHFGAGSMLDEVQKFIQQMPSNITVDLRGNTSNKIIQEFYSSTKVDLFVNLSIVEGLPVSIMEALSYKIPVLATSVNGTPEAVIDGENGFLLDVDFSIDELVSKIKDCINNPELINRMREKSYSIYREKFNAEVNYTAFASDLLNL